MRVLLALLIAGCTTEPQSDWQRLGDVAAPVLGTNEFPALAIDATTNAPVVAYHDDPQGSSRNVVHVARWTGTTWEQLPEPPHAELVDQELGLAIDSTGAPVLAFAETVPGNLNIHVHVARYANGTWSLLGDHVDDNNGRHPSLVLDRADRPIVAWGEGRSIVGCARWDEATGWTRLGYPITGDGESGNSVVLGADGNPIIAYQSGTSGNVPVIVARWEASAWVPVGAPLRGQFASGAQPALAVNTDGTIVATYQLTTLGPGNIGHRYAYIDRYDGTAWTDLGEVTPVGYETDGVAIATADDVPIVVMSGLDDKGYDTIATRLDGEVWSPLEARLDVESVGNTYRPAIAVDATSQIIVAYEGDHQILVKQWMGP